MDAGRLKASLVQTLENFQRSGLSWVPQCTADELPSELSDSVNKLVHAEAGGSAAASSEAPVATAGGPSTRPPATATEVPPARQPASTSLMSDSWSLPVLSEAERQDRLGPLNAEVQACRNCTDIVSYRQQTVFGTGNLKPRLCFMGEAPGADEDRQGVPFVGRAGQLLTKIIAAMQLSRDDVYILNALKCRPPQNRTPVPEEIEACRHFVEQQLEILQPEYIVCLGAVSVRSILQSNQSIGRLRGRLHSYRGAKVVVTYHPSYLLRNESAKRLVWDDMKMLMAEMNGA